MLFKITNGAVSFGAETVLEYIDFEIDAHQKIALVGRNGCGKSTLLKAICNKVDLEEGTGDEKFSVMRPGAKSIGYLKQSAFDDENITLGEEILKAYKPLLDLEAQKNSLSEKMAVSHDERDISLFTELEERFVLAGGYYYKKEYESAIKSFGFTEEDKYKPLCCFSGGQRTKIAFLRLLLEKPEILLLDEPTNHLDVNALLWLEEYLSSYKNSVVIVSHDRMFLDKIADVVYEIEYGVTHRYKGNYSAFLEQKKANYIKSRKDYDAQQKEIARLTRIIERFKNKPTKVAMTRSKLKQIEHMVKLELPDKYDLSTFHANFEPEQRTVENVLQVSNLTVGYDYPLATLDFLLKRGNRLGVIGGNGLGKSTFVKTLVGKIPALSGDFKFGLYSKIGYFDQQMALYSSNKTVFDDFYDEFPSLNETQVRSSLAAFQFTGDDVFKRVDMLSGGERVRLALCKIFKRKPNVLVLDEPTNHMDIVGKDTLERMLADFDGTVIFVSHDRYFVNKLATCLVVFEQGTANFLPYGYEEYIEKRKNSVALEKIQKPDKTNTVTAKNGNIIRERKKEEERAKRRKEKLETKISEIENTLKNLEIEMSDESNLSDYEKLNELENKRSTLEDELLTAMLEWDEL